MTPWARVDWSAGCCQSDPGAATEGAPASAHSSRTSSLRHRFNGFCVGWPFIGQHSIVELDEAVGENGGEELATIIWPAFRTNGEAACLVASPRAHPPRLFARFS